MPTLLAELAPRQVSPYEVDLDIEFAAYDSLHDVDACCATLICTEESVYCSETPCHLE
jgi:hypothetical protein